MHLPYLLRNSAKIIWSDINLDTRVVDFTDIKQRLQKTKAVVFVHLYGYAINLKPIEKYLRDKGIIIIEDCAQSLGAMVNNKMVYPRRFCLLFISRSKNITTLGEGGMLFFKNKNLKIYLLK